MKATAGKCQIVARDCDTNGLEVLIYVEGTARAATGAITVRAFKRALLLIRPMRETVAIVPAFQFGTQTLELTR